MRVEIDSYNATLNIWEMEETPVIGEPFCVGNYLPDGNINFYRLRWEGESPILERYPLNGVGDLEQDAYIPGDSSCEIRELVPNTPFYLTLKPSSIVDERRLTRFTYIQ